MSVALWRQELVALDLLHPHPRNYRAHPDDEIAHLMESIRTHGIYRNVVVSQDRTILAGHGVVEAARRLGLTEIPVIRLPYASSDPLALKLLVGDNEIAHLTEADDRALTELLKELKGLDELMGTGYDEMMLANLVMVTRPASEVRDLEAAAQWVGLPEYDLEGERHFQIIVNFATEADKREFCKRLGLDAEKIGTEGTSKSIWWPHRDRQDLTAARFSDAYEEEDGDG